MEEDILGHFFEWVHISAAFMFLIGVGGWFLTISHAGKEKEVKSINSLVSLGIKFKNYLMFPGETILFFAGLLAAWRGEVPILGFLQGGDVNWLLVSLILFLIRIPVIMMVAVPNEKALNKTLAEALGKGQVTTELTSALSDKTAKRANIYSIATYAVIVFLMVMKPF